MDAKQKADEIFWNFDANHDKSKNCVKQMISLIKDLIEESSNVHQSIYTPKKLCKDLLNPKLKFLEQVEKEIDLL